MKAAAIKSALAIITSEVTFLLGVRDEVEWIKAELTRMQDFLEDADEKRERNSNVRTWLMDIADVAYDVEDLMKAITLKNFKRNRLGLLKRYGFIINHLIYLHKLGTKIAQIKVRIQSISERRVNYNIENILDQESSFTRQNLRDQRRSSAHIGEMAIVGLEEDVKKLKGILIGEDPELRVISIVGMGGLGKTTLAKLVYNSDDIKRHFQVCAWVYVSEVFNIEEIMGEIEKQVNISSGRKAEMAMEGSVYERVNCCGSDTSSWSKLDLHFLEFWLSLCTSFGGSSLGCPTLHLRIRVLNSLLRSQFLGRDIYDFLSKYSYLIVMDDIWTREVWTRLQLYFPNTKSGSRIIFTNRYQEVALYAYLRSGAVNPTRTR
ncbi:hypothetical protein GIB67_036617 [Kingdonia uniflora]|uniref:Disease resistance protein n=1 Tax=Kingdonia uniflora TaxID=39325 RepID=A0A7J7M0N8_9MAGN|nr:hypothetical protein GIB67_036617 [Kingdonia uniflora]